jgi:putative transposase
MAEAVQGVQAARSDIGVSESCAALGLTRSTYYRLTQPKRLVEPVQRKLPNWALSPSERQSVLEVLNEERFVDQAPAAVYHILLDEGRRLCSPRTMYRVLAFGRPQAGSGAPEPAAPSRIVGVSST